MVLVWVQTFLLSSVLLAEAYGSGGCFWDNGHLYREDQPSPAPGLRCLNWLDAQGGPASPLEPGVGNHNYCRNPDRDPRGPWCYVSGDAGSPEKVPCQDARCPGTSPGPRDPRGPGLTGNGADTLRARAAARSGPASPRPRRV
ncbi:PREDICTED: phosphoinositide-3-kinase-interacting protein 1-like [Chinchilla lanigera]|uniref:phosphoinositide-3-kinase-interacting protein 1-like n=1 Tax=Chinchilla lanigera TaxID=34839 RepID=UPI000696C5F2|nr:PREDICTED: phosphoinositide-3-kinase-interacting protein 1-like [Chinchilla lanigera]